MNVVSTCIIDISYHKVPSFGKVNIRKQASCLAISQMHKSLGTENMEISVDDSVEGEPLGKQGLAIAS